MKKCKECGEQKQVTEFYKEKANADGVSNFCKPCRNKKTETWREKRRTEYNEYMRKYRKTHPVKYSLARNRAMKHRYGIDLEKYKKMLGQQNGVCAICELPPKSSMPLVIDHCHNNGHVRGLLCHSCNRSLHFFEKRALLLRAEEYLQKHSAKVTS